MASRVEKELGKWAEDLRSQIVSRQQQLNFWATGRSADQLQVGEFRSPRFKFNLPILTTKGSRRAFIAYGTMQVGRKPGLRPPFESIRAWVEAKGISDPERSVDQLAFLIARAIGERGTQVFQGAREGLDIDRIVQANADELANIVGDEMLRQISDLIDENLPVEKTAIS